MLRVARPEMKGQPADPGALRAEGVRLQPLLSAPEHGATLARGGRAVPMSEAPLALSAGWRVMYHNERDVDRTGPASRNAAVALDVEHERPGFLLRPAGDDL